LTEAALEKRLRYAMACSRVVWRKKPFKRHFAQVASSNGQHVITLPSEGYDPDYLLRTLIHELAHVALPGELEAFGVFSEDVLERVIEPRMMDHLLRHPRKQARWLKAMAATREG
jgi:hypothetical protein